MDMLYALAASPIVWFYVSLFVAIALFKKIRRNRIAINTIWFSADGTVPEDTIERLIKLASNLRHSPYRYHYQLYFWTDTKKLLPVINWRLRRANIRVKDYRQVVPSDEAAATAQQWIHDLIQLGNEQNKVFYVLASDLLRLYLLLREFPERYAFAYSCYIDCNDIQLNQIPRPRDFLKIRQLAFHFVQFNFASYTIFEELTHCPDTSRLLLTNDVIVAVNKARPLFAEIFATYCQNVRTTHQAMQDMLLMLSRSRQSAGVIDDETVCLIIFTTTHMMNTLFAASEVLSDIFLVSFASNRGIEKRRVDIQDVAEIIDFERHYDKGATCLNRESLDASATMNNDTFIACRTFWQQLFVYRYKSLITEWPT